MRSRPVKSWLSLLLFVALTSPVPGRAADAPPAPAPGRTQRATAILAAQEKLKEVAAHCIEADGQQIGPECAIPLYYEAGQRLRQAGIATKGAPDHWWAIYEGLGLAFGRLRRFEKARQFLLLAGRIEEVGLPPREETAYQLASLDLLMGHAQRALDGFEVLFRQNRRWLKQARQDPALGRLRQGAKWKDLMERLGVASAEGVKDP